MPFLKSQKRPERFKNNFKPLKKIARYKRKKQKAPKKLDVQYAIKYLTSLLADLHQDVRPYRKVDMDRDLRTLVKRAEAEGPAFFLKTLPSFAESVFNTLEGHSATYAGFKTRHGLPVFMGQLVALAVGKRDCSVMSRVKALKGLYTLTVAFKKLRGPYPKDVLVNQFDDFKLVDASLPKLEDMSSDLLAILETARAYCAAFIQDIDVDRDKEAVPRPGPGATNSPLEKNLRYEPHVLYTTVDEVLPYVDWFYPTPIDVIYQSRDYLALKKIGKFSARYKSVPKTAGKARGICIEHNEIQFLQQAVARMLRRHIKIKLGKNIALQDQSVNALLALASSISKELATIDMSEASDRIARWLVAYLFQDNERLLEVLLALSTRFIQPPEECNSIDAYGRIQKPEPIEVAKFAPMGSALCFPVMSLVHYFLIKAIMLHTGNATSLQDSLKLYVYGDDILLPTQYTTAVYDILPKFGMKLNTTKSFVNSNFRESCGVHAYLGVDVTPVYVKHTPIHTSLDALASSLANERDLFNKGFRFASQCLATALLEHHPHLYEVYDGSGLLGFQRRYPKTKRRLRQRWNEDLQYWECKVPSLVRRTEPLNISKQTSAYMRYLGTRASRTDSITFETLECLVDGVDRSGLQVGVPVPTSELKVRSGWVPR